MYISKLSPICDEPTPKIHPKFDQVSPKSASPKVHTMIPTAGRLVFVRFLEEFEDTKKTFRN